MTDRILGPAYPALLAPGLSVFAPDGERGWVIAIRAHDVVHLRVAWEREGSDPVHVLPLRIDYADPHTRDRVARALRRHVRGWAQDHDTSVRWEHYGPAWVWILSGDDSVTHEFAQHGRAVSDRIIVPALGSVDLRRDDYDEHALRAVAGAVLGGA